mmetsp:Transcript_44335/g.125552  ORF Transcript_44335/g.125552 Transcript_44335/m.125552 type:complete len:379 (-) Transcript_44335:10-1146(-)
MEVQAHTPRLSQRLSVPPREPQDVSQHQLKELNRNILGSVASFVSTNSARPELRGASQQPSPRSGPQSARRATRAEHEAQRRKSEHAAKHAQLEEIRIRDEQLCRENRERMMHAREQRFEAMLDSIVGENVLRVEAERTIRDYEDERHRKKQDTYEKWDAEVSQRIEHQLARFMTKEPPPVPAGLDREHLLKSDDPVKASVRDMQAEEKFHRVANLILQDSPRTELNEHIRSRQLVAESVANRERCRSMLPVQQWDQHHHYDMPHGRFLQGYQQEGGFRTARRMGTDCHQVDESDGVQAAGKTKTRFERNKLGMLEGRLAKEGESSRHKRQHGASSGAPCQDHFHYERGNPIVDAEFPIGKRTYPLLSGGTVVRQVVS